MVENALVGYRFGFGPPTNQYSHMVFGGTHVHPHQAGLSLAWHGDEDSMGVNLNVGPVELWVVASGFDASILDRHPSPERVWLVESESGACRSVHVGGRPGHVGVLAEWLPAREFYRLTVGPLAVMMLQLKAGEKPWPDHST